LVLCIGKLTKLAREFTLFDGANKVNVQRYALITKRQEAAGLSFQRLGFASGNAADCGFLPAFNGVYVLYAVSVDQLGGDPVAPKGLTIASAD
jgi:hypothetical protein